MRMLARFISIAILLGAPSGNAAEHTGHNEQMLRKAIAANKAGTCPEDLMAPMLRGACLQQIANIKMMLTAQGDIKSVEFLGTQQIPNSGVVEVYKMDFPNSTMIWTINTDPSGKIAVLWTLGPVQK